MYKHIYFDLDRTLWDFEANAKATFEDIFQKYYLEKIFNDVTTFVNIYYKHNERLWMAYRQGKIKKSILRTQRFNLTLEEFGIKDKELATKMGEDYINISPTKTILFPDTHDTLNYLAKDHKLYIITNGFEEVQIAKIKNCNLEAYFQKVITSEQAGCQKPKSEIFAYALKSANAKKSESIMIGDNLEIDIKGARNFGIDQVFFNPKLEPHNETITHEITTLGELRGIFSKKSLLTSF